MTNDATQTPKIDRETLKKLRADLRGAALALKPDEVRYLVDLYYQIQDYRIQAQGQDRAAQVAVCGECGKEVAYKLRKRPTPAFLVAPHPVTGDGDEECPGSLEETGPKQQPNALVSYVFEMFEGLEDEVKRALDHYTEGQPVGVWLRSIRGIGPVISAGLIAHVYHLDPFPTSASHLMSFAGMNPDAKWEKGERRPWNARLKTLVAYKLGESFVKVHNHEEDFYGKLYAKRKRLEESRNERLEFKDQAAAWLLKMKDKSTEAFKAYSAGRLPKQHVHARARRVAVKMFLSHYYTVCHFLRKGELGPRPYALEHLPGHNDVVPIPCTDSVPGFAEALKAAGRAA